MCETVCHILCVYEGMIGDVSALKTVSCVYI